jgi:hypothetical protein
VDDGPEYGYDVCAGELRLDADIAADFRAILQCLHDVRSSEQVKEQVVLTGPLPTAKFDTHVGVVDRGLKELRTWLHDKGTEEIKRFAQILT